MEAYETCVSIAKKPNGRWELDGSNYNQSSYGCVYKPDNANNMIKYDTKVNGLQGYKKHFFGDKHKENISDYFPMDFQPMTLRVRHSGDPLLSALNITPNKGTLDFGEKK
jgi:hypothetical protein